MTTQIEQRDREAAAEVWAALVSGGLSERDLALAFVRHRASAERDGWRPDYRSFHAGFMRCTDYYFDGGWDGGEEEHCAEDWQTFVASCDAAPVSTPAAEMEGEGRTEVDAKSLWWLLREVKVHEKTRLFADTDVPRMMYVAASQLEASIGATTVPYQVADDTEQRMAAVDRWEGRSPAAEGADGRAGEPACWPSGTAGHALGFVNGTLMLFCDGSGGLSFRDDELGWDTPNDSSVDYRTMPLPASEIAAIRDQLNRLFPPAPDAQAVIRKVTAEMRRYMPNACGDWADRIDAVLARVETAL